MKNSANSGLSDRILEWSEQYGKHFCLHDIAGFFPNATQSTVSGILGYLEEKRLLVRSSEKSTCKLCDKRHLFYIYSGKKPAREIINIKNEKKAEQLKSITKQRVKKQNKEIKPHYTEVTEVCPNCGHKRLIIKIDL